MSNSEQKKADTIEACREISARYRERPVPRDMLDESTCPLCHIHLCFGLFPCRGCPLANSGGGAGCLKFRTYEELEPEYHNYQYRYIKETQSLYIALEARAKFFDRLIETLVKLPASQFTRENWTYLDIPRNQ